MNLIAKLIFYHYLIQQIQKFLIDLIIWLIIIIMKALIIAILLIQINIIITNEIYKINILYIKFNISNCLLLIL